MPQLMNAKTFEVVGDPEPGVIDWRGDHPARYISTPLGRSRTMTLAEARAIAAADPDLAIIAPDGVWWRLG